MMAKRNANGVHGGTALVHGRESEAINGGQGSQFFAPTKLSNECQAHYLHHGLCQKNTNSGTGGESNHRRLNEP
jgi:hypothetical protein